MRLHFVFYLEETNMEWTREKRYKKYSDWDAETLLHLQTQAAASYYQMHYHIHPLSGLINDPNGFSYYNGEYHLFCQSYPFGPVHGKKCWIHFASPDLVHWRYLGQAIEPDTEMDNAGAYSGSAMEHDGKLLLMYSGNHRDPDWTRISYQLIAEMDPDNHITKWTKASILPPDHVTEHFRDPQLFEHNGKYYVILGAQDQETKAGHIDVYESTDLENWQEVGYLHFSDEKMGYMIECPNLVFVDDHPVLIFCPQGLDKKIAAYDNIYPNMYLVGQSVDLDQAEFVSNQDQPLNLDDGFDVYATQAFNAPDGNAYAISWVGLPDCTYPTDSENWANTYSQVKRLEVKNGKLYQHPVQSMTKLRHDEQNLSNNRLISQEAGLQYEIQLHIEAGQAGKLVLNADHQLENGLVLNINTGDAAELVIDRGQMKAKVNEEYGTTRTVALPANQDLDLDIFVDGSLCEIFINNGEHVATQRFFVEKGNQTIAFDHDLNYDGQFWKMYPII